MDRNIKLPMLCQNKIKKKKKKKEYWLSVSFEKI